MDFEYAMYMAESENLFPREREQSIQHAIEDFCELKANGFNPNLYIHQILESHHLKEYNLTRDEIMRINRAVDEWS